MTFLNRKSTNVMIFPFYFSPQADRRWTFREKWSRTLKQLTPEVPDCLVAKYYTEYGRKKKAALAQHNLLINVVQDQRRQQELYPELAFFSQKKELEMWTWPLAFVVSTVKEQVTKEATASRRWLYKIWWRVESYISGVDCSVCKWKVFFFFFF